MMDEHPLFFTTSDSPQRTFSTDYFIKRSEALQKTRGFCLDGTEKKGSGDLVYREFRRNCFFLAIFFSSSLFRCVIVYPKYANRNKPFIFWDSSGLT